MERKRYERSFSVIDRKPLKTAAVIRILDEIFDEHSTRKKKALPAEEGGDTKNESAKNFLRREIYALGIRIRNSSPEQWQVEKFLSKMGRSTTRPEALENVFHALLFFLYEREDGFTRQERSLIGRELEYAYRHDIPSELLVGFLYQSTDRKRLGECLSTGFVEPAFRAARV